MGQQQIGTLIRRSGWQMPSKPCDELRRKAEMVVSRYGDFDHFKLTFNPDMQIQAARYPERAFFGDAPTLAVVNLAYPEEKGTAAAQWIIPQLYNLSEYCGCKDKLTGKPLDGCAETMAQYYHWLKVSELLLFFANFKAGEYGRFYGAVDPLVITTALRTFVNEDRANAIDRREAIQRQQEREQWEHEWLKGKKLQLNQKNNRKQ